MAGSKGSALGRRGPTQEGGTPVGDKTEKATPKRRRDERKKGNVLLVQDIIAVATLIGSVMAIRLLFPIYVERLREMFTYCYSFIGKVGEGIPIETYLGEIVVQGVVVLAQTAGLMLCVTMLMAVVATFAQTKLLVTGELLKPKFNRISPAQGIKRLFSLRSIVEALKGILKISILLYFIYTSVQDLVLVASNYLYTGLPDACRNLLEAIFFMMLKVCMAFTALAGFDFLYQWWDHERKMKMSKQEIKEEYKQTEGDPQVKSRIKEIQRKMAQGRMMQQVPAADVVIRNPTHYAIALRYRQGENSAPVVLAMGQDELAMRIVRKAEECGIPTIENVPLAHALYENAAVDQEIPPDLYGPVAEVLVYVYKLANKLPAV